MSGSSGLIVVQTRSVAPVVGPLAGPLAPPLPPTMPDSEIGMMQPSFREGYVEVK